MRRMGRRKAGRPRVNRRVLGVFAKSLLRARTARGISQEAAARELGITWRTYSRYELGEREPWGPALPFFQSWIDGTSSPRKGAKR